MAKQITTEQASKILKIKPRTVRHWVTKMGIGTIVGHTILLTAGEVMQIKRRNRIPGPKPKD